MQVPGVGPGPIGTDFSSALRGLAGPKGSVPDPMAGLAASDDAIAVLLRELTEPQVARLLEITERPLLPENAARVEALLQTSSTAAAEGNVERALAAIAEVASLDPRRAATLDAEPRLASIRPEVQGLMFRLASAARLDAETRLEQATQLSQTAAAKEWTAQEIRPEVAALIAGQLLEAGGYVNYVHSAELSQQAINQYGWVPAPVVPPLEFPALADRRSAPTLAELPALEALKRRIPALKRLWQRLPLLVLLLAWFALGVAGGSLSVVIRTLWPRMWLEALVAGAFQVWGVGFLALISFAFFASIRKRRR